LVPLLVLLKLVLLMGLLGMLVLSPSLLVLFLREIMRVKLMMGLQPGLIMITLGMLPLKLMI